MTLQLVPGQGLWVPAMPLGQWGAYTVSMSDSGLLDADLEEFQVIGDVRIEGGGSKTFGTSGSKIGWFPGASCTIGASSVLTVGVKKAASISASSGPPMRATVGAAAFDVYTDITAAPTSTTWTDISMASGTPFTVADGDQICISFFLSVSGASSIKVRTIGQPSGNAYPGSTLVTASQATFTRIDVFPNVVLTFDDGTLGWIEESWVTSVSPATPTANIGSTNIQANIVQFPFSCKVDAMSAYMSPTTSGANFAFDIYSTPLGTPAQVATVAQDATEAQLAGNRMYIRRLATPYQMTINTAYAYGVRQTTATAVNLYQNDVTTAGYLGANGLDANCYAANSTAGATFAAQNSGKRRYQIWLRISQLDDGAGGGSAGMLFIPDMAGT